VLGNQIKSLVILGNWIFSVQYQSMNALEKFAAGDDASEARLAAEHTETKREAAAALVNHLQTSLEEAEIALTNGDRLTAAQKVEDIKSRLRADVEEQLLSGSELNHFDTLYNQLADKIYFPDEASRDELSILEGAKRDFFEKAIEEKIVEIEKDFVFGDDSATNKSFQELESLAVEHVTKNLSKETREKLEGTLEGLRNRIGK
jgi:hypothetical protein